MVGIRRVLDLYLLKPRVFPRRLVEMAVNAEMTLHLYSLSGPPVKGETVTAQAELCRIRILPIIINTV
jgi:hypothetical protein